MNARARTTAAAAPTEPAVPNQRATRNGRAPRKTSPVTDEQPATEPAVWDGQPFEHLGFVWRDDDPADSERCGSPIGAQLAAEKRAGR